MDRRGAHDGGNVRRRCGHVRCLEYGSLATSSLTGAHLSDYTVWIPRTKLPKTNEEEEAVNRLPPSSNSEFNAQ
jgi:hypothetical protein